MNVPAWTYTHTSFRDATPPTYPITANYNEVMVLIYNSTDLAFCPHIFCRIKNVGGVDQTACITTVDEVVGTFEINTVGCTAIGTGTYSYQCSTARPWLKGSTNASSDAYVKTTAPFDITINDLCEAPNSFTSLNIPDVSYEQYLPQPSQIETFSKTVSDFLTIAIANGCAFTSCQLVTSTATTCSTNTGTGFVQDTISMPNVQIQVDTSN